MGFRREIGGLVVSALGNLLTSAGGFAAVVESFSGTARQLEELREKTMRMGPLIVVSVTRREWVAKDYEGDASTRVRVAYLGRFRGADQATAADWDGRDKSVDDALDEIVAALQNGVLIYQGVRLPPVALVADEAVEDEQFGLMGVVEIDVDVPAARVESGDGLKRVVARVG